MTGLNRIELATMVDDIARRYQPGTDGANRARAAVQWLCGRTSSRTVPPLVLDVLNEYTETVRREAKEGMRGAAELRQVTDALIASAMPEQRTVRTEDPGPEPAGLTDRERQILCLIGNALSNRQIAGTLKISEKTVKNHITSLFAKLGVSARTEALVVALRMGASVAGHDQEITHSSVASKTAPARSASGLWA